MGRPLKIAKGTILTITAVDGTNEFVTVSENLNALNIIAGMPFVTTSTVGGLTDGTTYWILEVLTPTTFSVSSVQPSANPNYTRVNLVDAGPVSVKASVGLVDTGFYNPNGLTTSTNSTSYGVVGGNTALYGKQTLCQVAIGVTGAGTISCADNSPNLNGTGTDFANSFVNGTVVTTVNGTVLGVITDIANANATFATFSANASATVTAEGYVYATNEPGYILRQKGKTKYLVTGATSGLVGQCFTSNLANAELTPNTMNILATYADASTAYVNSLNDYQSEVFLTTVAASSLVPGTQYTIYRSGDTNWTSIGSASNMTGVTFTATAAGSGTGTAIAINANSDVIATFDTAYAANTYGGQPNPIVTINNN